MISYDIGKVHIYGYVVFSLRFFSYNSYKILNPVLKTSNVSKLQQQTHFGYWPSRRLWKSWPNWPCTLKTVHLWNFKFNDGKLVSALSKKDNSVFYKDVSK